MREGRHQSDRRHQHTDDARVASPGDACDEAPQRLGDAGPIERGAQDEHAGDHDRRLAGEAGQGLAGLEEPARNQSKDDQNGHYVVADPLGREQHEGAKEDGAEEQVLRGQPAGHDEPSQHAACQ